MLFNSYEFIFLFLPIALADNAGYEYFFKLKEALLKKGVKFFDFSNPIYVDSVDCEFIDGIHGGEVVYMKILLELADKYPLLNNYIDTLELTRKIINNKGMPYVQEYGVQINNEVDFLKLGCYR